MRGPHGAAFMLVEGPMLGPDDGRAGRAKAFFGRCGGRMLGDMRRARGGSGGSWQLSAGEPDAVRHRPVEVEREFG